MSETVMTPETLALRELLAARCDEFQVLLDRYSATNPKPFGSVACGIASAGSGIDILVEMDPAERNLQIIGEAVNHLPDEITGTHPEIPWPQSRGFRNILVHQ